MEAQPWRTCAVYKSMQQQAGIWAQRFQVKCFDLEREKRGKNKLKQMSVKMLMIIVVVEGQVPHIVNYIEEGTTRTGRAGYKVLYKFKKGTP